MSGRLAKNFRCNHPDPARSGRMHRAGRRMPSPCHSPPALRRVAILSRACPGSGTSAGTRQLALAKGPCGKKGRGRAVRKPAGETAEPRNAQFTAHFQQAPPFRHPAAEPEPSAPEAKAANWPLGRAPGMGDRVESCACSAIWIQPGQGHNDNRPCGGAKQKPPLGRSRKSPLPRRSRRAAPILRRLSRRSRTPGRSSTPPRSTCRGSCRSRNICRPGRCRASGSCQWNIPGCARGSPA